MGDVPTPDRSENSVDDGVPAARDSADRAADAPGFSITKGEAVRRFAGGIDLSVIEQFQRTVGSSLARAEIFQTPKWLETVLPRPFEMPAIRAMADASQVLLGSSSLSGLFATQEAAKRVHEAFAFAYKPVVAEQFGSLLASEAFRTQVLELTRVSDVIASYMSNVARMSVPTLVERAVVVGSRAWDESTRLLVPDTAQASIDVLGELGRGAAGIGAGGLLLADDGPEVEVEVLTWGPGPMHATLRGLLSELDPALPAKLDGAWERVSRPGPDAAAQAANSLMELVDWALRLAAPDDAVLGWVHRENKASELHAGRPTRVLRLKFLARDRSGEAHIARLYQRALSDLVSAVQSTKHSVAGKELDAVMSLVPTVEGLLYFALRP
jgi:hypothetical protein